MQKSRETLFLTLIMEVSCGSFFFFFFFFFSKGRTVDIASGFFSLKYLYQGVTASFLKGICYFLGFELMVSRQSVLW